MKRVANRDFGWIMRKLRSQASERGAAGMRKFGISGTDMLGVSVTELRLLATDFGTHHETALQLWSTGVHEARLLAGIIEEPKKVSEAQAEAWLKDMDSWDLVDQTCLNVYSKMPNPFRRARQWCEREKEFEKRTGFALIACLAAFGKDKQDQEFIDFLPQIKKASTDERNFVKKAVNWALRQIGKRNKKLHSKALACAKEIGEIDSPAAKWIASNAIKELERKDVVARIEEKQRSKGIVSGKKQPFVARARH